jgi:phosphatidylglycerol lysyltransferase
VPAPLLWIGGLAGSALGNAVGFGALTGGAVRYRVYGVAGAGAAQVARLTVLTGATFALGLVVLSGLGLVCAAPSIGRMFGVPDAPSFAGGLAVLACCAALIAWSRPGRPPFRLGRIRLDLPGRGALPAQLALVGLDAAGAGLALFLLLPGVHIGFVSFLAVYTIALLLGVIGHTPGGLGVFEASIVFALGGTMPPATAIAALLAYRRIYFVLPLLSGALLAA